MKFNELLAQAQPSERGEDILAGAEMILTADDLSENDKAGFATGFLMGLTYALAMGNVGQMPAAAKTLLRLSNEWEAHDVI